MALKDLFFKKTDEEEAPVAKKPPVNNKPVVTVPKMVYPTGSVQTSSTDYFKFLEDQIKANLEPGLCYKDFADSLESMAGQPLTEVQKYTIMYAPFRTQKMTPEDLVNSALHYRKLMDDVKKSFDTQLAKDKKVGVEEKIKQVQFLESEIQELTKQIQSKTEQINKLNQEAAENASTLESENVAFNQAYVTKTSIIDNHIQNIKNYLGNANPTKQPQG